MSRSEVEETRAWTPVAGAILVRVHVQPRSSRPGVVGRHGEAIKVRVSAPPVEGAANHEVVAILAEWLSVPRHAIAIVQGRAGRDKLLRVPCQSPAELGARLDGLLDGFIDKAVGGG